VYPNQNEESEKAEEALTPTYFKSIKRSYICLAIFSGKPHIVKSEEYQPCLKSNGKHCLKIF
jgi:hypothetical protein